MPNINSISQVRSIYDLIELYAKKDRDGNGLLGPNEVPTSQIMYGDKGGIKPGATDVADGFLSPWEVAKMVGLRGEEVRSLKRTNQRGGRAFENIERLPHDTRLHGMTFKGGSALRFFSNGRIESGELGSSPQLIPFMSHDELPAGTRVVFDDQGEIQKAILSAPTVIGEGYDYIRIHCPAGTIIDRDERDTRRNYTAPPGAAIGFDQLKFSSLTSFVLGDSKDGVLAERAVVPIAVQSTPPFRISVPKGSEVSIVNGEVDQVMLAADTTLFGFECKRGSAINGMNPPLTISGDIRLKGTRFSSIEVERPDASLVLATLVSEDGHKTSPEGKVFVRKDGAIIENSKASFARHYPHIELTGKLEDGDVFKIVRRLYELPEPVLQSIRGIHLGQKEERDAIAVFFEKDTGGHANYVTHKITLWKDYTHWENPRDFHHEAAHTYTYQLQKVVAKRIQELTRHIDHTQYPPGDPRFAALLAEEQAIVMRVMAGSFEGRWRAVADDENVYMTDVEGDGSDKVSTRWSTPNANGETKGPRYGCTSSYGCQNFWEDVAEHVEAIWRSPEKYRELLDPSSEFYREHPEQLVYAPVYWDKLELLREYDFITEKKYREVVPKGFDPDYGELRKTEKPLLPRPSSPKFLYTNIPFPLTRLSFGVGLPGTIGRETDASSVINRTPALALHGEYMPVRIGAVDLGAVMGYERAIATAGNLFSAGIGSQTHLNDRFTFGADVFYQRLWGPIEEDGTKTGSFAAKGMGIGVNAAWRIEPTLAISGGLDAARLWRDRDGEKTDIVNPRLGLSMLF